MRFGIYNSYWEKDWGGKLTPYVKRVGRLGFDVLEVSFANAPETPDEEIRELGRAARGEGVGLTAGYGPPRRYNCASAEPEVARAGVERLGQIFRRMDMAGIRIIGGGLYSYWPVDYSEPVDKPGDWARSVTAMRRVASMASDYGIKLGMEVLNRFEGYLINTADECRRFVTEVGAPNAGIMLDTFHMNIEEDSIVAAVHAAGDLLCHLHVGEANRRLPGPGGLPWEEIGGALRVVGFDGCVVMEPFVRAGGQIGADIKVWRDLSGGADDTQLDEMAARSVEYLRNAFKNT